MYGVGIDCSIGQSIGQFTFVHFSIQIILPSIPTLDHDHISK